VNDTLSTPDPATQVAEVRQLIQQRGRHSCEATLIAIRRVVEPPPAEPDPLEYDSRNWPILPGTAWERHDEPDVTQ
jgi:hypothetical protein